MASQVIHIKSCLDLIYYRVRIKIYLVLKSGPSGIERDSITAPKYMKRRRVVGLRRTHLVNANFAALVWYECL